MSQEEFIKELLEQLAHKSEWGITADNVEFYKKGFTADGDAEALDFIRTTNIRYRRLESDTLMDDFIVITKSCSSTDSSMSRFKADALYQIFKKEGWDAVWEIIQDNLQKIEIIDAANILSQAQDYEKIKEHLIIRPINYNDNRAELKNCIYKQEGDIALVLYILLSDSKEHGLNTAKVPSVTFDEWNTGLDEVWENALLNTYVLAPPRMYINPMDTCNPPYAKGAFMALGSSMKRILPLQVPLVTTTRQVNGAIALFYPGVQERIAEMAEGSFYAAFTSIHEARIHRVKTIAPRQILKHIKHMNNTFDPAEVLSRKVFYYDAEKKTFTALEL